MAHRARWNYYHCNIDEHAIKETAQALLDTGLRAKGYEYVNIDDCWQVRAAPQRLDGARRARACVCVCVCVLMVEPRHNKSPPRRWRCKTSQPASVSPPLHPPIRDDAAQKDQRRTHPLSPSAPRRRNGHMVATRRSGCALAQVERHASLSHERLRAVAQVERATHPAYCHGTPCHAP